MTIRRRERHPCSGRPRSPPADHQIGQSVDQRRPATADRPKRGRAAPRSRDNEHPPLPATDDTGPEAEGWSARRTWTSRRDVSDREEAETMAVGGEICRMDTASLARRIAAKELSPVEVVDAVLDRLEHLDPTLHMFATVVPD